VSGTAETARGACGPACACLGTRRHHAGDASRFSASHTTMPPSPANRRSQGCRVGRKRARKAALSRFRCARLQSPRPSREAHRVRRGRRRGEEAEHPVGLFQVIDTATPPIVDGLDAAFVPPHLVNFDLQFGPLPKPFSTAPISQSYRGWASIKITRSSANLAYSM
jgi:hypothetical protein